METAVTVRSIPASVVWQRCWRASAIATALCLVLGALFLRTTGVPATYPPLLPQQLIAGAVGGALLCTFGFFLLRLVVQNPTTFTRIYVVLGILLLIASFHLPYRLSYTTSPRFAGVTVAAQFAQAFLHCVVVGVSLWFLKAPHQINPKTGLERYRDKFKHAPVGKWSEIYEYGPWEHHVLEIFPDGKGRLLSNQDVFAEFEWKESAEFEILVRITRSIYDRDEELEDGEEEWRPFRYDFKIRNYYGKYQVMFELTPCLAFGDEIGDLEYKGMAQTENL